MEAHWCGTQFSRRSLTFGVLGWKHVAIPLFLFQGARAEPCVNDSFCEHLSLSALEKIAFGGTCLLLTCVSHTGHYMDVYISATLFTST